MSRHGKFYSGLKTGAYENEYDEDDDYDYDNDYYEEEEYEEEYSTKAGGGQAAAAQPKNDAQGISYSEADYDLLAPAVKKLRGIVGPKITNPKLIEIIREANYDEAAAILAATEIAKPAPKPTPKANAGGKQGGGQAVGGGKKLVIGGSSAASSPSKHADPVSPDPSASPSSAISPGMLSPTATSDHSPVPVPGQTGFTSSKAEETIADDGKQTVTAVIAGHVDSGKSTILGHLLVQLGTFSERDVVKNERKGKEMGKASFKYAWMLDQSEEERRRGVTIDAGTQSFDTEHKHINILDCPGHIDFVMNMITSATQADVAMLVVTASPGEFESGLNYGTKEHLTILKTLGVSHILVVVNKMDTVQYSKDRFDEVVRQMKLMIKQCRFKETDIMDFVPVSGLDGTNLFNADNQKLIPWYEGGSLTEELDKIEIVSRLASASLRVTIQDVGKQLIYGRVECGGFKADDTIVFVPCGVKVKIKGINVVGQGLAKKAVAGETVEISTNSDLTGLYQGCVGCFSKELCTTSNCFEAHIQTFSNLEKVMLPGSQYLFACHSLSVQVTVATLVSRMDKSGKWSKGMVKCVTPETQAIVMLKTEYPLALEPAENCRALGRFVLRQEGETIGGGLVKKVN